MGKITITAAAKALRAGEVSAAELTRLCLENIEKLDGELGAFLYTAPEKALEAAESADRLIYEARKNREENSLPLLTGIPAAVKDNLCTCDAPTTCASLMLKDYTPPYDAAAVEKLRDAGSIIVGKTNLDEFAMGDSTQNSAYKKTKNPLDPARLPGGSSGGSAAAVASCMCAFALGTDTAGSVREPAAACGIVGFRPTYGGISRYGMISLASSMDTVGVLTHSVADCAAVYLTLAGRDGRDATSRDSAVCPDLAERLAEGSSYVLRGLRVGIIQDLCDMASVDVKKNVLDAARAAEKYGAALVQVSVPDLKYAPAAYSVICAGEASSNLARFDGIRFGHRSGEGCSDISEVYEMSRGEGFGEEVKRRILFGTYVLGEGREKYWEAATKVRRRIAREVENALCGVDILLYPSALKTAGKADGAVFDFTGAEGICSLPASFAGIPAITLPCGRDGDGMPVGLQLAARADGEELLFRAASALEVVLGSGR